MFVIVCQRPETSRNVRMNCQMHPEISILIHRNECNDIKTSRKRSGNRQMRSETSN